MNGAADSLIHSAAAQVSAHGSIDFVVAGFRRLCEQCSRRHDLAALAVPALWHLLGYPCSLYWMRAVVRKSLDGRNLAIADSRNRSLARARCLAIEVHGAGAADA